MTTVEGGEVVPFGGVLDQLSRGDRVQIRYEPTDGEGVKNKSGTIEEVRSLRGGTPKLVVRMDHINSHSRARWYVTVHDEEPSRSGAIGSRVSVRYSPYDGSETTDRVGTPVQIRRLSESD